MPEIKNYSQWSADNALDKDPIDALREYTDYARMQYLRSGVPMNTVEPELRAGIEDKLKADGLLSEETTPEQLNELQTRLFAPKANLDFDAAVVQNYLALDDPDSGDEETKNNSSLLRDYLAKKKYSAELAAPLEGAVKDLLQDGALVRRARVAAVDRGEYNAIAVTEDDGTRNVYAGSRDLEDSEIPMVAESLVRSGALDTSDIVGLQDNYRKVFGGKSTLNQNARSAMFNDALDSLSKTDPEIADILSGASAAAAKQESLSREGFVGKAAAFATGSLAAPFVGLGEAVGAAMGLEQPKPTGAEIAEYQFRQGDSTAAEMIRQKLLENPAMRKRFSEQEISAFTNDRVLSQTDYKFDNTKPESGLRQLSTGEVNIAPALLASPQKLEDALGKAPLNEEQKEFARKQRAALLDVRVPQMLKLIASSSDEAVSAYATAKQNGVGDREFVEQWLSNEGNYSSFGNRAASFGLSALRAIGEVPLGIAALAGSETATNIMLRSQAKQSRYAEYGALFGDEFGLAQEALNTLPAVAVDIALTIGTAGVGRAASAAARAGSMSARTLAKGAVGVLDDAALAAVRGASAGAAAETSAALQAAGRSWISKAATTAVEQTIPVALPAFTRSASSTYVSIYGSLPEDMTHEEKHKQAIGFALAAGVGTAAITAGLSALGFAGVEKLGVRTAAKGLDDLTYREAKVLFESVKNEGKAVSDKAFRGALAAEVGGNYKRLIGSTAAGFRDEAFEEALDQSINMAIEDAALKKNRPLAEKLQQVWNAGLIGGVLGGGLNLASQALAPTASAQTKALQQRTAVLDGIAKRLSTSNAPETAASVQRMMDAANAAAVASTKKDTAAAAAQTAAAPTTAVRTVAEQLEFKFDDPRGVPPADTRLADLIGERVYIGDTGINGIAEIDTNTGEVVINFSKPTKVKGKPNVTRYVLGTKFQKATGVTLKPKIKTLTKPVGGLPAGTRIFNTNKLDFVLPSLEAVNKARTEGKPLLVLQRDEKQRVIGVTLRGVALVASPTTTTDTTITDPDLMREVLRFYPAPAAPTGGFQLESGEQLELDFNAPPPAPAPTGGFQLESGEQLELDFNAPPEPELQALLEDTDQLKIDFEAEAPESTKTNLNALSVILAGDPVLNFLRAADPKREGFTASVQQISDGEWAAAGDALDAAYDFIADLGDSEPLLTKAALDTLGPILFKYDTGTTIRKRAAAKSARRNQGKTPAGPAPEAATEAPAPVTPTPEAPAPAPAAKKAARKAAKAEPTKEQVLDEVGLALVKLEQALLKERKLGSRQLGDRKIAREISDKLTSLGYAPADTPEGFFLNVVDAGDPSAFERLVGAFQWASGQPEPVSESAAETPTGGTTEEDVLNWLSEDGNAESLVGKQVRLSSKMGGDTVTISSVEGQTLFYLDPDPRMGEVEGDVEAGDFDPESFTRYLESPAGEAEPVAAAARDNNQPVSPRDRRIEAPVASSMGYVVFEREDGTRYQLLDDSRTPVEFQNLDGQKVLIPGYETSNESGGFTLTRTTQKRELVSPEAPVGDAVYTYVDYTGRGFIESATSLFNQGATRVPVEPAAAPKGRGTLVGQPTEQEIAARVNDVTSREEAIDDWFAEKRLTLKAEFDRLSAIARAADPTDELFRVGSAELNARDTMLENGIAEDEGADYWQAAISTLEMWMDTDGVDTRPKTAAEPAPKPKSSSSFYGKSYGEWSDESVRQKAKLSEVQKVAMQGIQHLNSRTGDRSLSTSKRYKASDMGLGELSYDTNRSEGNLLALRKAQELGLIRDLSTNAKTFYLTGRQFLGMPTGPLPFDVFPEAFTTDQQAGTLSMLAPQGDNTLRQNVADIPAALQGMLPAGFTLQADPNMDGALGYNAVTDPTVVRYNPNLVGDLTIGLARADALATLRTAVDHELGHAAAEAVYTPADYQALADELGTEKLAEIVDRYYSGNEPDFEKRAAKIAADRARGAMPDWKIAAEWVRMEIERIANGRTSEQRMLFLRSKPSLLAKFIDALGAFVTRLRARFFEQPTTGTAASISNAARQLRKMRNGGYLPAAPKADLNYGGHAAELIGAIERGSDQTLFTMPIGAATAAGKAQVEGLWTRIGKKFQNLPPYLRDNKEERDGIMALGNNIILNFNKRFSKLTKENPAIPIDDIRTVLGRTDPTLDNAALALIQTELDAFAGALPFNMDTVLAEEMIDKERDRLQQRERLASNNAFRKEQQSAEQRIRNAGAPALADLLVKFRTDINNMSARFTDLSPVIDENMGVYLTRTYRFHNTEGWALLAAGGIQPDGSQLGMFRGKEIDFAKLRDNAARTYEQDALAKAAKDGVVLTAEQLRDRTHEMLDKYLAKLQGSAESSPSPSQDSLQKDLTKLMPKGNINKELMELLGVIEDPLENAVRTMVAVTKIAANNTFLRSTYDTLLSMNLASTKQTPEMGVKALRADKDGSLSPLSDLFTTPEIANALQAEWGVNARNAERNTDSVMREGGRALMAVASFATTSKTLLSFGFYPRNAVSGQGLLLSAQGILPINRYTKEAYGLARRAYFESNERTPEQDAMIQRLIELQVLADDTQGRVAMDIMRGFVTDNEQDLDALLRDFQEATEGKPKKLLDRIGSSAAGKTYGKTIDILASLNNLFDGAVKTQAYMYELDVLKKDNAAALAKDPTLLAGLELRAADKVKMTMPSHSRQLPIVKSLNQTSVGMVFFPFARWKTEVFRTMYNTPRLALKEIREGGPAEKARGWKRLTGFTGTLAFGGSAVGTAYAAIFRFIGGLLGEDEEKKDTRDLNNDELYALRESLPVWQRGHALHTRLVGGQVQVIDMTAITPYAQLTDLFVITHEGIVNKESDWNAKRTAGYVAQQLIGTQIAATALNEVLNNSDDFGQPVYRDTDNPVEVTGKILAHFGGSALKPAAVDQLMRATRGGEQDRWEIITGELIGARPRNHKMSEIEYRAFRGVKKMLDDSAQIKASLVTGRKIDDDEVVKTLEDHQESLNRTQRKLAKVMQGLQSMGSTRGGLFGSGKNAGFSAQRLALAEKGDNLRWVPNQDWLKGVYQNMTRTGEDDPMNRINLIRRTLSGMPATYGVSE